MAVNVSAWAIRNPLPPIVIMAALIGIGYLAFKQIPITRMPNIDIPVVSVIVTQFGASPGELETQVGKKIEDAVAGVSGVHHIYTTISDGLANTTIEFLLETDTDRALNDIKDAVTGVRADLPRGIDEPQVRRFEVVGLPILTYAAIAPGKTPEQLSWFVEDVVVRKLQGLRGVASVDRIGSVEREIRVGLNPIALQGVGITAVDVRGDTHARGGANDGRPRGDPHCAAARRGCAARRYRHYHGRHCGAAHLCAIRWQSGGRLQHLAR